VYAWGCNSDGQLGHSHRGTTTPRLISVSILSVFLCFSPVDEFQTRVWIYHILSYTDHMQAFNSRFSSLPGSGLPLKGVE